ncbi:MAG: SUMF1/EgtB/PvdO family nonheme iron enzyme [Planctomycetota bacterium]
MFLFSVNQGCEPRTAEADAPQVFPEIANMLCVRGSGAMRPFLIDCYEVTNQDYADFLLRSHYQPDQDAGFLWHWWRDKDHRLRPPAGKLEHPVTFVSYADAEAYARFHAKRLPTKREWERAAAPAGGVSYAIYPWGTPNFYRYYCNVLSTGIGDTTPVGMFPSGSTEPDGRGCHDMAGNVWEWIAPDPDDPLNPPLDATALAGAGRSLLERSLPQSDLPGVEFRQANLQDWPTRVIKGGSFNEPAGESASGTDWAQIVPYRITAGRERAEDPKRALAESRSFDLGFRCVRDAEPFADLALDRLSSLDAKQSARASRELGELGDDFWDLLGERDQHRREVVYAAAVDELIESLFAVTERDHHQEVCLVTESGAVIRLGQSGERRFRVDSRAGVALPAMAQPTVGMPLGADRIAVCWRSSAAGGAVGQVAISLLSAATGQLIRAHVFTGDEIVVLPATSSHALVMVNRTTWVARFARLVQRVSEPWLELAQSEWHRFRFAEEIDAEGRHDAVAPGCEQAPPSFWLRVAEAIAASRDELFYVERYQPPPRVPMSEVTDLALVRLADGALVDQRQVWSHLDLPDPAEAQVHAAPAAVRTWLLAVARGASFLRVRVGGRGPGRIELEPLGPIDAGGAYSNLFPAGWQGPSPPAWEHVPLQFVPADGAADQGELLLIGPSFDGVLTLASLTAGHQLVERWSQPLFTAAPVLTSVQLVRPGKLLLEGREGGEGHSHLVSLATGARIELGPLGAPCLVSDAGQQTWLSFAGLPGISRGLAYCRAEAGAPLHYLRVDTLGSRHILFDATGKGDLRLLLSRGATLRCFDLQPRHDPLDHVLEVFLRERTHAAARERP